MKRILLLCFLFFYSHAFSQEKNNPFHVAENATYSTSDTDENQFATVDHDLNEPNQNLANRNGPPGDDDTVPIDDYLPFLVVVAFTIIGYIGRTPLKAK